MPTIPPSTRKVLPVATLLLVAANLAVAFLAPYSSVLDTFAFNPAQPNVVSALTSLFLHDPANILHLLGNMVFLAAVGPLVENSIGYLKYFSTYLLSGIVGVATHWAMSRASGVAVPLIGASAAVSGCVGYCCLRFMKRKVFIAPNASIPVTSVILIWFVLQILGTFVHFSGAGGTAYGAHVGGFVGGFLLAFLFKARTQALIEHGHERIDTMEERSPAAALVTSGEHLGRHPNDVKALWVHYESQAAMGETDEAARSLVLLLKLNQDSSKIVRLLKSHARLGALTPSERMRLADRSEDDVKRALFESVVAEPDSEPERPNALLALASMSTGGGRDRLIYELKEKYALHSAAEAARIRGLL